MFWGWANRSLQIEKTSWRGTLAGCRVIVCEHWDGRLSLLYGSHRVGLYTADFTTWVADQLALAPKPIGAVALSGEDTFRTQCSRCHQVNGLMEENPDGSNSTKPARASLPCWWKVRNTLMSRFGEDGPRT